MEPKMNRCVIIGSSPEVCEGDFEELNQENVFIICADGGYDSVRRHYVNPDLLIGDFDSVLGELPAGVETIRLDAEKDDTDMMAAIRIALQRGYRDFVLLGGLGGRIDHSFANFCALQYLARQGCSACLKGKDCAVYFQDIGILPLDDLGGKTVSLFPFGAPSCTVTYRGLKYPLYKHKLTSDYAMGVSNIVVDDRAEIRVHDGSALIMVMR